MDNIYLRTKQIAQYMLDTKSTIRGAAAFFGMAKSTVHYDLQYRLKFIDTELYQKIVALLEENFMQKSIRGGNATKNKYLKLKSIK